MANEPLTRVCARCHQSLPADKFGRANGRLRTECKSCRVKREKERRERDINATRARDRAYRIENRDHINSLSRDRYHADPNAARAKRKRWVAENRAVAQESWKKQHAKNAERNCARARAWYAENTERAKTRIYAWAKVNQERCLGYSARRRARKSGADAEIVNPLHVFERDGWICRLCQKPVDRTKKFPHPNSPSMDHIVPLVHGGPHRLSNLQCAHLRCNLVKGDARQSLL